MTTMKRTWEKPWTDEELQLLDTSMCNVEIGKKINRSPLKVGIKAVQLGKGLRRHGEPLSAMELEYMVFTMGFPNWCAYMAACTLSRTYFATRQLSNNLKKKNDKLFDAGVNRKRLANEKLRPMEPPAKGQPAVEYIGVKERQEVKPTEEYQLVQEIDGVKSRDTDGLEKLISNIETREKVISVNNSLAKKFKLLNALADEDRAWVFIVDELVTEAIKQRYKKVMEIV